MAPLKAPGSNGMSLIFYQWYWPSIGGEVVDAMLSCLNLGKIISGLNHTFLTIILKVKSPNKVFDF